MILGTGSQTGAPAGAIPPVAPRGLDGLESLTIPASSTGAKRVRSGVNVDFEDGRPVIEMPVVSTRGKSGALVKANVNPGLLEAWLRDIATSPDKYASRNQNGRKKVVQLIRATEKLANNIERTTQSPPILFMATGSEVDEILALPTSLRRYAFFLADASLDAPYGRG